MGQAFHCIKCFLFLISTVYSWNKWLVLWASVALNVGFVNLWFVPTDGSILYLYFYYLMNLNIMTVKTKVSIPTDLNSTISAGCVCVHVCSSASEWKVFKSVFFFRDLLKSDTLLSCLYADDHGGETPNPANRYQFDKVGWEYQR